MFICPNRSEVHLHDALRRSTYVLDFDGVIVHRFTQFIDFISARKELAKVMIERGFNVDLIRGYIDPYDLIKLCYGEWGIHKDFQLFSKILEEYELVALHRVVTDLRAKEFLELLISNGKEVYISSLQPNTVISFIISRLGIPTDKIRICGRDAGGRPKPYTDQLVGVEGDDAVVLGDSCTDGYLARNLGSYFIGLSTNGYTEYELCSVDAVAVFNDLGELLEFLLREVLKLGES